MAHATRPDRPFVSAVDLYILEEVSVTAASNRQLKPYRCRSKRELTRRLEEFQAMLDEHGSFILTFEDQVTVEVFSVSAHDRAGRGYNNARRYFVICEIESDCAE